MATEIVFLVEADSEGGFVARARGDSIFTQAADMESIEVAVRDALDCHYPDAATRPEVFRLLRVQDDMTSS